MKYSYLKCLLLKKIGLFNQAQASQNHPVPCTLYLFPFSTALSTKIEFNPPQK